MTKLIKQWLLFILLSGAGAFASAHTYFVGLTDISLNPKNDHLEIIHLYTTHDIEHVLMETNQQKLDPEHPKFEQYLQSFLAEHFKLIANGKKLDIRWLGFEFDYDKIVVYQEVQTPIKGNELEIYQAVLSDFFAQQVNTVNYTLKENVGTLTFDKSKHSAKVSLPAKFNGNNPH